jgi:UDP-glucose 4-epimerase
VNLLGLINMLEAARESNLRRLTIASSVATYSGLPKGPYLETTGLPTVSTNPTEAFKKAEEVVGLHYADRTGIDLVALRIGGIWGPLYHSMANLPSRVAHAAVHGTEPDFSPQRGGVPFGGDGGDMCYVKDCAQGIQLVHMASKLNHRVYNVGAGRETKNAEVLDAARRVVPDAKGQVQSGTSPRYRPDAYMDLTRIKEDVGYQPQWDIYSGLADYIAWLRNNPQ